MFSTTSITYTHYPVWYKERGKPQWVRRYLDHSKASMHYACKRDICPLAKLMDEIDVIWSMHHKAWVIKNNTHDLPTLQQAFLEYDRTHFEKSTAFPMFIEGKLLIVPCRVNDLTKGPKPRPIIPSLVKTRKAPVKSLTGYKPKFYTRKRLS